GVSAYDSRQAGSNAVAFTLRMAEAALGKFLFALGDIAGAIGGPNGKRDRNRSDGQRKQISHVNSATFSMRCPGPARTPFPRTGRAWFADVIRRSVACDQNPARPCGLL